jgi:hypothetical protein
MLTLLKNLIIIMPANTEYVSNDELVTLQEQYEKVKKLLDEESKTDPPTEPYRSKYKARSILNEMKSTLSNTLEDSNPTEPIDSHDEPKIKVVAMLGTVLLNLGMTSYETEEISTSEEQLNNCVALLMPYARFPTCIITLMKALNQLGIIWSERDDSTKSLVNLNKCELLYKDYNDTSRLEWPHPVSASELFNMSIPEDPEEQLEKTHTLTLYYLAQVYGVLGKQLRSAVYCHNTLKRQLESKSYDPIDWALNAATLSQFFAAHNGFEESRHHLAAASVILDQLEAQMIENPEGSEEERDARYKKIYHRGNAAKI